MSEKKFNKIDCNEIKVGMRFTAPVFFDDGENMFLGEQKSVKNYHIDAIQRWDIKYLLTYGHLVVDSNYPNPETIYLLEDLESVDEGEE